MSEDTNDARRELESLPTSTFITKWIFEHTPFIFSDSMTDYISWREALAMKFKVDPSDIIITGSACLGFSINPGKNFKIFNDDSDIDVSIVSNYYFDTA